MQPSAPCQLFGPTDVRALTYFLRAAQSMYPRRARRTCVFGSRARWQANEGSDLDACIVVDGLQTSERHQLQALAGDVLTEFDVDLGVLALSAEHWMELQSAGRRIAQEIQRDGIPVETIVAGPWS
jgi:predicted nucleotidyltransferase